MHRIKNYLINNKIITEEQDAKIWESKLAYVKEMYQESVKELDVTLDEVFDSHIFASCSSVIILLLIK
jgi:pyruvate dehydrogenase E1 component alpha subunit